MQGYWKAGLNAFSVLSAYRSPVPADRAAQPELPDQLAIEATYQHTLLGILRNGENTKLQPSEELIVRAVLGPGSYLVQVENYEMLSGPMLAFQLEVTSCDAEGNIYDRLLFEDKSAQISSKASPVNDSFSMSRFEVAEGHALLYVRVTNTGSNRGCKGLVVIRGSTDTYKLLDSSRFSDPETVRSNIANKSRWFAHSFKLLPGESFASVLSPIVNVQHRRKTIGSLFLTNYQLVFMPHPSSPSQPYDEARSWMLPLGDICQLEWQPGDCFSFKIRCRTFNVVKFCAFRAAAPATNLTTVEADFRNLLTCYFSAPESVQNTFAFLHGEAQLRSEAGVARIASSWRFYDPVQEYARSGLYPSSDWRLADINKRYELSETYPRVFAVPQFVTDEELRVVAKFRSRARIPVAVWRHPQNSCVLIRCSQPLTGIFGKGCPEDAAFFQTVRQLNIHQNPTLYIFDARPHVNALSNSLIGKGTEDMASYPNCQLRFLDVDNIQVMNKSARRLREICISEEVLPRDVENCDWLQYLARILTGTLEIAKTIDSLSASVVIHCSDGWDRTAQLTALVELCLDPYFRTIAGFAVLIEKEWLSFGHQFAKRVGFGAHVETGYLESWTGERSPIFLQWIDCVHQLVEASPQSFEFNDLFLRSILHHLYSLRFGSFLCNSEKERQDLGVPTRTLSIWSLLDDPQMLRSFSNPMFEAPAAGVTLLPVLATLKPKLWREHYLPGHMHSYEQ